MLVGRFGHGAAADGRRRRAAAALQEQPSAGRVAAEEESCAATRRTTPSLLPVKLVAGHSPPLGLVATLHLSSSSSATAVTAACVRAAWRGATS